MGTGAAGSGTAMHGEHREREKFDRIVSLGRSIESLRAQATANLSGDGMDRARVLPAVVGLLDLGCFWIGGEQYAAEQEIQHRPLPTEHVRIQHGAVVFSYSPKSPKWREVVSEHLGNTPAVCASSYIDARVMGQMEHAETVAPALARVQRPELARRRASVQRHRPDGGRTPKKRAPPSRRAA